MSRSSTRPLVLCLVCLSLLFLVSSLAVFPQAKQKKVVGENDFAWQADLTAEGYTPLAFPSEDDAKSSGPQSAMVDSIRLGYLDEQIIVLSFVRQNQVPELQRRDDPNRARPYTLHAFLIDAATGKVVAKHEFPSDIPDAFLMPRDDGNLVLFDAERVAAYTRDAKLIDQILLKGPQDNSLDIWGFSASETGRSIFAQFRAGEDASAKSSCEWVDTMEMNDSVGRCNMPSDVAISDGRLALFRPKPGKPEEGTVAMANTGGGWHDVCDSKKTPECHMPQFVRGRLLIQNHTNFLLLGDAAENAFHPGLPDFTILGSIVGAIRANKVAVEELLAGSGLFISGTSLSRPMQSQLVIFDPANAKWAHAIEFKRDDGYRSAIAISPGAKQAAIFLGKSILRAYPIPESTSAK